jgi:phenylacetate-CoA ligase
MITDFQIQKFFYPIQIIKYKKFLNRAEKFTKNELIEIQNKRLRLLIRHCYQNVPYYHKLFQKNNINPNDIQAAEHLRIIPPLTKKIVRENFKDLISKNKDLYRPVLTKTSGSTGTPLKFYLDKNINIAKFGIFWRVWGWTGYRLGMRWAIIGGPIFKNGEIFKYKRAMNALYISSFHMRPKDAEKILLELVKFKPKMLRGYPSAIYEFTKMVHNKKLLKAIGVKTIVTGAETLLDFQRDFIQNAFGCKVYDNYSLWEQVCIISECEFQVKHHQMEYGILEILDQNDNPVQNEIIGEITGTNLVNLSMPLIRYKTRDLALRSNRSCKCGRKHDVIDYIDGRIEDIIVTPDGRHVGRMDAAFKHIQGIDYAQIIQDDIEKINVRLVKNEKFYNDEIKVLEKHIRERVGNKIKIDYQFTEKLNYSNNGKLRFVINNINTQKLNQL